MSQLYLRGQAKNWRICDLLKALAEEARTSLYWDGAYPVPYGRGYRSEQFMRMSDSSISTSFNNTHEKTSPNCLKLDQAFGPYFAYLVPDVSSILP